MAWRHYPLRFRLLSPLHVGYRKVGNLMQTRPYIPGKPLWAALTARLTLEPHSNPQRKDYKAIGDRLQKYFRFGYLWPSLDGETPYFWWEHEDFEYVFLGSYVSTALDYGRMAAEEGSLHEIEFISPYTRDGGLPVYLVGDLWVQEDELSGSKGLESWQEALGRIQLGGERGYGWGRVQLLPLERGRRGQGLTVTGFRWQEQANEIIIKIFKGDCLPAHAVASPEVKVIGPLEPLVGWERADESSGRVWELSEPRIVYAPGARADKDLQLVVSKSWGLLEAVEAGSGGQ